MQVLQVVDLVGATAVGILMPSFTLQENAHAVVLCFRALPDNQAFLRKRSCWLELGQGRQSEPI